ncbi:MAG: rRNA maturation RNase YbeY [Acidimicrobiales bacterium]|nr:rRNA maturation RNase YbeY [Acidimicrobiales bacterium]
MIDPHVSLPVDHSVAPSLDVSLAVQGIVVSTSDERQRDGSADAEPLPADLIERISAAVHDVFIGEGVQNATSHVFFVAEDRIAALNAEHLGGAGPTDVLSFPLDDPSEGDVFGFTPHAGDIVICPVIAQAQASQHAGTFEDEMVLLAVHAALHLLGHDHHTDAERTAMQTLEARYLSRFGITHPGDQL